ncbi:hypothetical protein MIB92_00270 [Aestuariirhabdus sp. Z084]|nr:hypothetical protein [Aestuariirhabdus haliotis]MCL6414070.1 hypothetical protein [Aestuariirhabdus haliotis]MCL6418003.1 hypothetical protein [Aestuariirhabdus haliotis]
MDKAVEGITSNISTIKKMVDGLPIFISLETSEKYSIEEYDEKHYFVIPYELSDYKFALHTTRCLPTGVPEINDLPKRRIFHFANEHAELALKSYMLKSVNEDIHDKHKENPNTLESLANDIDALDKKLTYGMLLVGGVTAIFNPLIGAGIAVKALLPGAASFVNKYGVRPAGEKLSKIQLEKDVRKAEEGVAKQFEDSDTLRVVNPILQELEFSLRTSESEHDPLTDPNLANGSIPEITHERWRELTEVAICHVYKEVYEDSSQHKKAKLGPEDLRWLKIMFDTVPS